MKKTKDQWAKYRFSPEMLDTKREDGISAFMRIKNGDEFLELAILSHIEFFDEIIACYNDCTDNTKEILQKLQKKYPQKLKIYHYQPAVYPPNSQQQKDFADGSSKIDEVHSLANYYNWTLSKTTKKVALKLDDDQLAVKHNLSKALKQVRKNGNKRYYFSGINLMRENDKLGVTKNITFAGNGDHLFFPVSSKIYFVNIPIYEAFYFKKPLPPAKYVGLTFLHLKFLKKLKGFAGKIVNDDVLLNQTLDLLEDSLAFIDIETFAKIKPKDLHKVDNNLKQLKINPNILNFPLLVKIMMVISSRFRSIQVKRALVFKQDISPILADWQQIESILKNQTK